jgi:Fe-S-cluster containining protein
LDIQYEWDRCNKLCDNNRCTIYDNRPKTCSDFECLYVESDLPEEYLPEKVGFVTNLRRDEYGLFLNIVPNESKKYNIDARKFGEENMENILVMKKTAEEMWFRLGTMHVSSQCGFVHTEREYSWFCISVLSSCKILKSQTGPLKSRR